MILLLALATGALAETGGAQVGAVAEDANCPKLLGCLVRQMAAVAATLALPATGAGWYRAAAAKRC